MWYPSDKDASGPKNIFGNQSLLKRWQERQSGLQLGLRLGSGSPEAFAAAPNRPATLSPQPSHCSADPNPNPNPNLMPTLTLFRQRTQVRRRRWQRPTVNFQSGSEKLSLRSSVTSSSPMRQSVTTKSTGFASSTAAKGDGLDHFRQQVSDFANWTGFSTKET